MFIEAMDPGRGLFQTFIKSDCYIQPKACKIYTPELSSLLQSGEMSCSGCLQLRSWFSCCWFKSRGWEGRFWNALSQSIPNYYLQDRLNGPFFQQDRFNEEERGTVKKELLQTLLPRPSLWDSALRPCELVFLSGQVIPQSCLLLLASRL